MAKSKTKKDSTLPLVISLVFFVLATIVFGVMWYTTQEDIAKEKEAAKKAQDSATADKARASEQEMIARAYRAYIGVASPEDVDNLGKNIKEGDAVSGKVVDAIKKLDKSVEEKEATLTAPAGDKKGPEKKEGEEAAATPAGKSRLAHWKPAFDPTSKGLRLPEDQGGLVAKAVTLAAERDTATAAEKGTRDTYVPLQATAKDRAAAFEKSRGNYDAEAGKAAGQYQGKADEIRQALDANKKKFDTSEAAGRKKERELTEEIDNLKLQIDRLKADLATARSQNQLIQEKVKEKQDTFQYDEPQGRITRRVNDDVVEIDLGWVARVRPGLTFTVLPRDFPEKGRQSRTQMVRVPDNKGGFKSVERFVPKATLEVIEVLGPNSARARIADEDVIRDKVLPGDLLYNSIWRRGQADHIALVGIFDVNGDGTDDVERVVKDLKNMGIPVDAVFDLRTQKWVGRITEQTRYVVQGAFPTNSAADPHQKAKTALLESMSKAIDDARAKGVQVSNYRDFFPRMGYRIKQDVSEDKVNQAAGKYLGGGVGEDPNPMPNP
jgi:hypothetical protein